MTFPTFFFSCICLMASATWKQHRSGETHTHHAVRSCPSHALWSTQTSLKATQETASPAVQGSAKHSGASAQMHFGQSWAATLACP